MLIEVCVDSPAGLAAAVAGGADRIELCSALSVGGLTPSVGFMALAARAPLQVYAMIRPRPGSFVTTDEEVGVMCADIAAARSAGLAGVVLGASLPDCSLDAAALRILTEAAKGLGLTLHRAFDLVPDLHPAIEVAVELGFHRILTSGRAATVGAGAHDLATTIALAAGRIAIMPGAGVNAASAPLLRTLGVAEVHGSFSHATLQTGPVVDLGFAPATSRSFDPAQITALRAALTD